MSASAKPIPARLAVAAAEARVGACDWDALATELDGYGCAVMAKLLTADECAEIAALYPLTSSAAATTISSRPTAHAATTPIKSSGRQSETSPRIRCQRERCSGPPTPGVLRTCASTVLIGPSPAAACA